MRKLSTLIASIAAVLTTAFSGAVEAAATPIPQGAWTITPGGWFNAISGQVNFGAQFTCRYSRIIGGWLEPTATGSPARLGWLPEGSVRFEECGGPFGLAFTVTQIGVWDINGHSYSSGVTTGTLTNVQMMWDGFDCRAKIEGYVNTTYTNSTYTLRVLPNYTLTVTWVDPNADCFGMIQVGNSVSLTLSYTLDPPQTITPMF